jgi:hypothetical protein
MRSRPIRRHLLRQESPTWRRDLCKRSGARRWWQTQDADTATRSIAAVGFGISKHHQLGGTVAAVDI